MQKEYFMVLDTETANSVEQPLPYDIIIIERERQKGGRHYER